MINVNLNDSSQTDQQYTYSAEFSVGCCPSTSDTRTVKRFTFLFETKALRFEMTFICFDNGSHGRSS